MRRVAFLLAFYCLFGCCRSVRAQDQNRPFIKIAHVGPETQPVYGLFISPQTSALDEKLVLAPGYRTEPVFIVRSAEFSQLVEFVRRTASRNAVSTDRCRYGSLKVSLRDGRATECFVIGSLDNSLVFISSLADLLDGYSAANRRDPALWEAVRELRAQLSI